ncbi:deoxycytidylate deaminase [Crenobacter caeni]|nr:deoxycytidylate deaminase [Crenobacter caeni]
MDYVQSAISKLYGTDDDFIVIGLTGRTGSGCSTAAKILSSDSSDISLSLYDGVRPGSNSLRKQRVVHHFFSKNWKRFALLQARSLLTLSLSECESEKVKVFFDEQRIADKFEVVDRILNAIRNDALLRSRGELSSKQFYSENLVKHSEDIKVNIGDASFVRLYQTLGVNYRRSGSPIDSTIVDGQFFQLAELINEAVKHIRDEDKKTDDARTYIVIDAIRNPLEAIFFQEKYSSFYLVAVSCEDASRKSRLCKLGYSESDISAIDNQEYKSKDIDRDESYVLQDIEACLQRADIYLSNPELKDGVSKPDDLANQIVTFVSLMQRPGLVTPTNMERCMQIAHTAKLNSGCISRQVGAAITDENFSIRAIGWNDVPSGQVPCNLRSVIDLSGGRDSIAYSNYEKNDSSFVSMIASSVDEYRSIDEGGRWTPYCFKGFYNKITRKENQVHTRSLHAEENAFLQISKYGGVGIVGGKLFTTASPCELCAKKAYQMGVKQIIYIDPYPGIAMNHILDCGTNKPEMILFSGAIGSAFHRLYTPKVPYKDEIRALLRV